MPAFNTQVLAAAGFPVISYDILEVGQTFRSDERLLRPQDIEAYAYAVDDHDSWFFELGPFGSPIAHPTILANQALFLRHNHYTVPAGLHAQMTFEFLAPIPLGTRARTLGTMVDKYWRRDKPYMVTGYETLDETGTPLVRGRFVQMLFTDATAPPPGSGPKPEPEPERPALDPAIATARGRSGRLSLGQSLPALVREVTQRKIDIYSGVKPGSIHTDPEWARAKGFGATIAQRMMSTAYVSRMITEAAGRGFVAGGTIDCRFLRPVLCGDVLTIEGTIVGFAPDPAGSARMFVAVTATNQRGEQTLGGTASALVD
ncbi:MAG: MaoC/PaaZ C-terminal domain-containing protein [Actinomycetota bacterium]|nr:MaoC/PaaZ C-terminal domain-containing protein [Actinomycetota bacterium]